MTVWHLLQYVEAATVCTAEAIILNLSALWKVHSFFKKTKDFKAMHHTHPKLYYDPLQPVFLGRKYRRKEWGQYSTQMVYSVHMFESSCSSSSKKVSVWAKACFNSFVRQRLVFCKYSTLRHPETNVQADYFKILRCFQMNAVHFSKTESCIFTHTFVYLFLLVRQWPSSKPLHFSGPRTRAPWMGGGGRCMIQSQIGTSLVVSHFIVCQPPWNKKTTRRKVTMTNMLEKIQQPPPTGVLKVTSEKKSKIGMSADQKRK